MYPILYRISGITTRHQALASLRRAHISGQSKSDGDTLQVAFDHLSLCGNQNANPEAEADRKRSSVNMSSTPSEFQCVEQVLKFRSDAEDQSTSGPKKRDRRKESKKSCKKACFSSLEQKQNSVPNNFLPEEEELQAVMREIPSGWSVVMLCLNQGGSFLATGSDELSQQSLMICKISAAQKGATEPNCSLSSVRLHVAKKAHKEVCDGFSEVMVGNKATIAQAKQLVSCGAAAKQQWWETRRGLDEKLAKVLDCLENNWLGCWKGMLLGEPSGKDLVAHIDDKVHQLEEFLIEEGFREEIFERQGDARILLAALLRAAAARSLTKKQVIFTYWMRLCSFVYMFC